MERTHVYVLQSYYCMMEKCKERPTEKYNLQLSRLQETKVTAVKTLVSGETTCEKNVEEKIGAIQHSIV